MRDLLIGLVVGVILSITVFISFFNKTPKPLIETITVTDTLLVETTKTYPIYIKEVVPEIVYLSPDSTRYIATKDTTIVDTKVTANIRTVFRHPEKTFDLDYIFHVKVDSVFVTNTITEYRYINQIKTLSPTIGVSLIKSHTEDTLLLALDAGIVYKNKFGLQLITLSDMSLGLRLQALF